MRVLEPLRTVVEEELSSSLSQLSPETEVVVEATGVLERAWELLPPVVETEWVMELPLPPGREPVTEAQGMARRELRVLRLVSRGTGTDAVPWGTLAEMKPPVGQAHHIAHGWANTGTPWQHHRDGG